jgi:predicted chitinase
MRSYEFDYLNEDFSKWVKGGVAALTLAATGNLIHKGFFTPGEIKSMDEIARELEAKNNKIKADPHEVNKMIKVLNTPIGKSLVKQARQAGMKGRQLSQFLAQCAHETLDFQFMEEMGDKNYFNKYDIKHNPKKAKELGNINPGDGYKYRGRGFIQLTGRDNYRKAGKALGLPLEEKPELVENPEIAAKVAIWFWKNRVQPKIDDYSDTIAVTRPINKGLKGIEDREKKYKAIAHILGVLNWPNKNKKQ